ncbi:MAG: hypothetical protein K0R29_1243 [Pseudobdellovibrio sp.]|nr:hypothetical protein [Pseudobdellovibrio sp.]
MANVVFPLQFNSVLQGQLNQSADGTTVSEVLKNICAEKPALKKLLFLDTGSVSPFLVFTIAGENKIYPAANAASQAVTPGQTIEILVGMAGG